MQMRRFRAVGLTIALMSMMSVAGAANEGANEHAGVTRPMEERSMAFSFPGVVREVAVKEGDSVKAGQALMRLEDRLDRNALAQYEIEANSKLKVEYAEKSLAQKKVRLDIVRDLAKDQAATSKELEEATLDAELADTQLRLSIEENQTAKLKATGQRIKLDLTELNSTIDGIVRKINVKSGEYADPQQSQRAACIIVQVDPLKVEVFMPSSLTRKLTLGQQLEVAYQDEQQWQPAKITFFDPVADPASGLRMLQLEMPNPQKREPGLQVKVRVPATLEK